MFRKIFNKYVVVYYTNFDSVQRAHICVQVNTDAIHIRFRFGIAHIVAANMEIIFRVHIVPKTVARHIQNVTVFDIHATARQRKKKNAIT